MVAVIIVIIHVAGLLQVDTSTELKKRASKVPATGLPCTYFLADAVKFNINLFNSGLPQVNTQLLQVT